MKGCTRGRLHAFHRSGPQPDTEEEGSALDFPEVLLLFRSSEFCAQNTSELLIRV